MARLTFPRQAFLLLTTLLWPLFTPAAPQLDTQYGPLPVFELHSGFWINLHHTLYQHAKQLPEVPRGKSDKPALQIAPGAKPPLTASEQHSWDEAVSYYAANYAN